MFSKKTKYFELLQVIVKAELKLPCEAAERAESVVVYGREVPFRMPGDEGGLRT